MGVQRSLMSRWINKGALSKDNLEAVCKELDMPVSRFVELGEQ